MSLTRRTLLFFGGVGSIPAATAAAAPIYPSPEAPTGHLRTRRVGGGCVLEQKWSVVDERGQYHYEWRSIPTEKDAT